YPDTDWLDVLWNPAPIQDHTLRLSGGTDLARFALSLSYMDQEGMLPNTAAQRQGLRLNTDFAPSSRLRVGLDVTLRRNWDLQPRDLGEALFRMFHDTPPTTVAKFPSQPASMRSAPCWATSRPPTIKSGRRATGRTSTTTTCSSCGPAIPPRPETMVRHRRGACGPGSGG